MPYLLLFVMVYGMCSVLMRIMYTKTSTQKKVNFALRL